jgi:hypothetical protein
MFRYWGAIGDFYYFVTFLSPLWKTMQHHRIILAADVYVPRYGGDPLLEICQANGLVDEVWEHSRDHGGPTLMPAEFVQAATGRVANTDVYTPGIYYSGDKWLHGPGVIPVPVDDLRQQAKMHPKFLIPIDTREKLVECYPDLEGPYMTVQPYSIGKRRRNVLPLKSVWALNEMNVPMVVLRFKVDAARAHVIYEKLGQVRNVRFIDVYGPLDSLFIQAHAQCHLGIESSQILGAGIHDVPCVFYEYGGWVMMARDLAIEELWKPVKFDHPVEDVASMVYKEFTRDRKHV